MIAWILQIEPKGGHATFHGGGNVGQLDAKASALPYVLALRVS